MNDTRLSPEVAVPSPTELAPTPTNRPTTPNQPAQLDASQPTNPEASVTVPNIPEAIADIPTANAADPPIADLADNLEQSFDRGDLVATEAIFAGEESPLQPGGQ